jgi:hypothetical protein
LRTKAVSGAERRPAMAIITNGLSARAKSTHLLDPFYRSTVARLMAKVPIYFKDVATASTLGSITATND